MQKIISQSHYRKYNQEDIETIWMLADVGIRTCNFLLESATEPEQFEQTDEVKRIYVDIKNLVEYTLNSNKRKSMTSMM